MSCTDVGAMLVAWVFCSLFLRSTGKTQIPETTNVLFQLINDNMTRDEASFECSERGGRLVNIYDELRKFAVSFLIKYMTQSQILKTSFWIGLHDVNKAGLFQWSDCSPVTTSYWGNTSQTEGIYCVSANPKDLSWQIHPCTDLLPAVCETPEPCKCTISLRTRECADMERTISSTVTGLSEEACKIKCLLHVRSNDQCWGLSYDRETSTCFLHERLKATKTCNTELRFYTKVCFTYNTKPQERLNSSYINKNVVPQTTCTEDYTIEKDVKCNYTLPEQCRCQPCVNSGLPDFWTNSTLKEQLDWLVNSLKVDKSNTSLMRRSKSSAADSRITAVSIGYAGAAILILIVGGIVILDLNRLWKDIKHALKGLNITH